MTLFCCLDFDRINARPVTLTLDADSPMYYIGRTSPPKRNRGVTMSTKTTATRLAILTLSVCVLATGTSQTQKNTSQLVVELSHRLDYARTDFNHAYTMVWAGEVNFGGKKVGEFTATMTKTTRTGQNGAIIQYDIIIPEGGPIAEFFSVELTTFAPGLDQITEWSSQLLPNTDS